MRRRARHGERGAVAVCDRAPTSAPGRWSALTRRDRRGTTRVRTDRGAAVVEFALIAPILLLLFFGVIDYSYMLNRDTMLNNSVRDAARTASLGGSYAEIQNTLVSELNAAGISTASPTVLTIDCIKPDGQPCAVNHVAATYDAAIGSGATAIVRVEYRYGWITPLPSLVAGSTLKLAQETQMRVE